MEDASNLDYQAGQEEEAGGEPQGGEPDKKKSEPEKQQQAAEGEQDAQAEDEGLEGDEQDGGVNEDTADKHEDRQFAQPEVCSSLRLGSRASPAIGLQEQQRACFSDSPHTVCPSVSHQN